MIYINRNKDILEKYEVVMDKDKLKELLIKVIKNCGEKHKVKEELSYIPHNNSWNLIALDYSKSNITYYENVNARKIDKKITFYEDYMPYKEDVYDCEYIRYKAPYFAGFISVLIYSPEEILPLIFENDLSSIKHFPTVEEKIQTLNEEISQSKKEYLNSIKPNQIDDFETIKSLLKEKDKIKAIEEKEKKLQKLLDLRELNINQEPITPYIQELLSLIHFQLIDTLEISEIERINSFFEKEQIKIENNGKTRQLSKNDI